MANREELLAEAQRRGLNVSSITPQAQHSRPELLAEAQRRRLITPQPAQPELTGSVIEPSRLSFQEREQLIAEGLLTREELERSGLSRPTAGQAAQSTLEENILDPNIVSRGMLAPIGQTASGEFELAIPEIALDVARAVLLPGEVAKGAKPTILDTALFSGSFGPGALRNTASALAKKGLAKTQLISPDGKPSKALNDALQESGTTFDDLTTDAAETLGGRKPSTDPAQAARAARMESQGVPATRGDITQDFAQQAEEARLVSSATQEAGEPLRQLRLEQSQVFEQKTNDLIDSLGIPSDAGDNLKAALSGRKELLTKEKNAIYASLPAEANDVPIITTSIDDAIPDQRTSRRIGRLVPSQVDAVDDLLVEFGINKSDEALEAFGKSGGEVFPLSLGNSEEFRQALNQIERSDTTGAIKVITGPIKQALDEEVALIGSANSSLSDLGVASILNEARGRVRELKTEFSPQSITGRLIDVKRDGITPVIEASKVTNQLLRPTAPIEDLRNTLKSLSSSGKKGRKAIGDLQASVVLGALNNALKAPSRKTSGIETIGGNQFAQALNKFGDDKLNLLFKGNESSLRRLKGLKQTALDITPTSGAVPKGSAPVILDIVKRAGRLPGLAAVVDVANFVVKSGSDERAIRKALNAKPELQKKVRDINTQFPEIAQRLGIVGILEDSNNE